MTGKIPSVCDICSNLLRSVRADLDSRDKAALLVLLTGATENGGSENDGRSKSQGVKMHDMKMQDIKMQDMKINGTKQLLTRSKVSGC